MSEGNHTNKVREKKSKGKTDFRKIGARKKAEPNSPKQEAKSKAVEVIRLDGARKGKRTLPPSEEKKRTESFPKEIETPMSQGEESSGSFLEAKIEESSQSMSQNEVGSIEDSRQLEDSDAESGIEGNGKLRPTGAQPYDKTPKGQNIRRIGSEYTVESCFDFSSNQFVASVVEFPDVEAKGVSRSYVLDLVEQLLEDKLDEMKRRRDTLPEAIGSKKYPETLQVPISQSLFRKLDRLSRSERVDLGKLVAEMLSASVEKRYESVSLARSRDFHQGRPNHSQQGQRHQSQQGQRQQNQQGQRRQHQQSRRNQGERNPQGRSYHQTMGNRDNFLEYVRNLEKGRRGGGGGGGWNNNR